MRPQGAPLNFASLAAAIHGQSGPRGRVLVGIDGPGGSGKSTLSRLLAPWLPGCSIVHTDDFFLPTHLRGQTETGLAPGFDLGRLWTQVLEPANAGSPFRYQRYDWDSDELKEWIAADALTPVIVEGVYALQEQLRTAYTFTIFCTADRATRLKRGVERDGTVAQSQWEQVWMPAEERYAEREHPAEAADLVVSSDALSTSREIQYVVLTCRV